MISARQLFDRVWSLRSERLREGAPLNPDVMATWYSQGPEGYIDYPALAEG